MTLHFSNGFHLDLALTDKGDFSGINHVYFEDQILRDNQIPWTFYAESEGKDGAWRFESFRFKEVVQKSNESTIIFTSEGTWLPRAQAADAMGDARIKTRRVHPPIVTFRWRFRGVSEKIWENDWQGLSMQVEVESIGWPIHWIIEAATWEIGGDATGCVLVQQDVSTIDLEQEVEKESVFSTIEKFFVETPDAWGGNYPMDMLPRAAGAASCDFQAKGNLAMCLYAPKPGLTRARLDKYADETVIHYTDRPFIALTERAVFPERRLLVHRQSAPLQRHEWRNLWLDCFTHTRKTICDNYGFTPEIPQPSVHSHLWDKALHKLGKTWTHALKDALPKYQKLGYKQVVTHGVWESITSDPVPGVTGNICSPYNFRFSEKFGGAKAMRELVAEATACGMDIFQWFSFHISCASSIWKEHPDWILREANGEPWDANYGTIWSGRIRSGYGKWFLSQIMDVHKDTGMQGIFWDSYQNLGVTCVDWSAPDKAPQAEEIWRMQGKLQRSGYKQRCEVVTIFGVGHVAMYGFENDAFRRRLWSDTIKNDDAFALIDCAPAFFTSEYPFTKDKLSPDLYFWLAAHRSLPSLSSYPWAALTEPGAIDSLMPGGDLAEEYGRVNHLYQAALPLMKRLRVQKGGSWVLWLDEKNQPSVAWAFQDVQIAFDGCLFNLETGEEQLANGQALLKSGAIYQMEPGKPGSIAFLPTHLRSEGNLTAARVAQETHP